MSFDPHNNLFYYYRQSSTRKIKSLKKDIIREKQIENNTTKALINTLQYTDQKICNKFMQHFLDIQIESNINYAFQKGTIGQEKINKRSQHILLGISPILSEPNQEKFDEDIQTKEHNKSVLDAWIWDKTTVIAIEVKTNMGFNKDQMRRHKEKFPYETKVIEKHIYWEKIHSFFINLLKNHLEFSLNEKDIFLIEQFTQYLELINLSEFTGWKKKDFDFFMIYDKDEKNRIRYKMKKLADLVFQDKFLLDKIEKTGLGRVKEKNNNIWFRMNPKSQSFLLNPSKEKKGLFLNFTMELYQDRFQISIVFPLFPSIKRLKNVIKSNKDKIGIEFKRIFDNEIKKNYNRDKIRQSRTNKKNDSKVNSDLMDYERNIFTLLNYKIRIFDHCFINQGSRFWIPKAEIVIDEETMKNDVWVDFLEDYINLYHPDKKEANWKPNWGVGVHILKEYPRDNEILSNKDELIQDVQKTLKNFYQFAQSFI